MKRYIHIIFSLILSFSAADSVAQTLPSSGTWNGTTITGNVTVDLTGDINLTGQIRINDNCTLTINNNTGKVITIHDNVPSTAGQKRMFYVTAGNASTGLTPGGKLVINGARVEGGSRVGQIVLDGGAGFEWNESTYKLEHSANSAKRAMPGAAICSYGILELSDVTFQNMEFGEPKGDDECFGAIALFPFGRLYNNYQGPTTLNHCTFHKLKGYFGPAIIVCSHDKILDKDPERSLIKIDNTVFRNCHVVRRSGDWNSGVIRFRGECCSSLKMTSCQIVDNYAEGNCAGLFWNAMGHDDTKCELDGCLFDGNWSEHSGGGLRIEGTTYFVNNVTTVTNNISGNIGGGIHFRGYAFGDSDVIHTINVDFNQNLLIKNNRAKDGGGIGIEIPSECSMATGSTFNFNINGAVIDNNTAELKNDDSQGHGGGVFITNLCTTHEYTINFNLTRGSISHNTALYGGALHLSKVNIKAAEGADNVVDMNYNDAILNGDGTYGGDGGGIYLQEGTVNLNVVNLQQNTAEVNGAGIYQSKGSITLKDVNIKGNTASMNGGGVYLSSGTFTLNTAALADNYATQNGGGVYMDSGEMFLNDGNVMTNTAMRNGGGVYMASGRMTLNNASVIGNKANVTGNLDNTYATGCGGGIYMQSGAFSMTSGEISRNTSRTSGGGIYIYNDGASKNVAFSGGRIHSNVSFAGGGIAVNKNVVLTVSNSTFERNRATNGGGILVTGGASMTYSDGLIRNNQADGVGTGSTAYGKTVFENAGIGGGIYVGHNSSLNFSIGGTSPFGVYGNLASTGADDVFASGQSTNITLPKVISMTLQDFKVPVPANSLNWLEDYVKGDTSYEKGLKKMGTVYTSPASVHRYQESLVTDGLNIYSLREEDWTGGFNNKYLCLALGYPLIRITIKKTGLKDDENAIFKISHHDGSVFKEFMKVILNAPADNDPAKVVSKQISLVEGTWKVEEMTGWSWSYTTTSPADTETGRTLRVDSTAEEKVFEFTNVHKGDSYVHLHSEATVLNILE